MPMSPLQQKFHRLIRSTAVFDAAFYAKNNCDVAAVNGDLLEHYIVSGERENRAPSILFDPAWYRAQVPKLPREHCLLAHYLTVGDADGLQPMIGFDPAYVRQQLRSGREPALLSYVRARARGVAVNPNQFFDYDWYLTQNPDVAAAGIDGYFHFVYVGADEGRSPSEAFSWFFLRERYHLSGSNSEVFRALMLRWRHLDFDSAEGSPSVVLLQDEIRTNHKPSALYQARAAPDLDGRRGCDVYAFYLTQFHRVAENDGWWGEGFTEWHNVVRGVPRFSGHYQPRIPSALGFYDLEDPRTLPRQIELATQAGLAGFAFYYYHFGEQRLLERPLERFLADPSLDCGFFLIWANETWSRRWDGSDSELLLEQRYPPGLACEIAADLARHFADPRYRRIGGRPLFVIYRVASLPDPCDWIERLRAAFLAIGEDPLIYLAQTFEDIDPRRYGMDGALEFPPHKHSRRLPLAMPERIFGTNPVMKVWDYRDFVAAALADPPAPYPLIRGCFPSWDNDSRRQGASSIIHGSTPELFRSWLEPLVDAAEKDENQPNIVCINAWNEWGEGAYLEPDRRFGYAYLNTVQAVMHPARRDDYRRIVLVGHDAFAAGAQRLLLNIGRTLKQDFAVDILFLLLRADQDYDALIEDYRAIAPTVVVAESIDAAVETLAAAGFVHAIVNSSASSAALAPLARAGIETIQLVHELPGVFAALGAAPYLRAAEAVRSLVVSTRAIAAMIEESGVDPARIAILPQGQYRAIAEGNRAVARAQFVHDADERQIVVGLGYGDTRKGIDLFVATAEGAQDADLPMLFVWQGGWDRDCEAALQERVEALIATDFLRRLPDAPDVDTLLGAADVFFLPSREDPLPSVAIEAWTCGLPVVAIRGTGGIADLIAEQATLGTLADQADAADLLMAVLAAAMLGVSPERAAWARGRFDWHAYVRALLRELYRPPPVDIAIIGHNHGRFAESRMSSLVRQTLPPRDIAYLDVASTDGSPAAVLAVARRLGVRFNAERANEGRLFNTWSSVASASNAPYLQIAEGDDWIAPTMIERCVAALEAAPNAAYAFCGVEWIDEEDRVIADHLGYPASIIGAAAGEGGEISANDLLGSKFLVQNPVLSISSVVWRRSALVILLSRNLIALSYLSFAFDWLLYLRAARAGHSAVFVPEPLCRHRQHGGSFANRENLKRHATEIDRVYTLEPAPTMEELRAAYLATLSGDVAIAD